MPSILDLLTPEQKQQLVAELLGGTAPAPKTPPTTPPKATSPATPPAPRRGTKTAKLDLSDAIAVHFQAVLSPNERCRDQSWAETYDTITVKGHYQVKGPKGGMYCLGKARVSNQDGDSQVLTFKISNKNYLVLLGGGEIDGWCVDPATNESVFIGTLSQYEPVDE